MSQNQNPTHWPAKIFDLHSLVVYSLVPWGTEPDVLTNFWWKDDRYPAGAGPFCSPQECVDNFKESLFMRNESTQEPKSNVIAVDFVNRKRL